MTSITFTPEPPSPQEEPIQYIQAIQPHGVLLIVEEPGLRIVQYSANVSDFLGLAPANWHNQTLDRLLGKENAHAIQAALRGKPLDQAYLHLLTLPGPAQPETWFHLFANRSDGLLLLELEKTDDSVAMGNPVDLLSLHNALSWLTRPGQLQVSLQQAVDLVKTCTGFERVMIYQFRPDGSGHVSAESLDAGLESYLGLHYPASDIPPSAIRLCLLRSFRFLPDVDYEPVPLAPDFAEAGLEHPVDLSFSSLRSVSPLYSQYLKNMGVKSTLVLPLMIRQGLWGLISCMHHRTTHYAAYPDRIIAGLLARAIGGSMEESKDFTNRPYRESLDAILERQMSQLLGLSLDSAYSAQTFAHLDLLNGIRADGVAIVMADQSILQGHTPDETAVRQLLNWLREEGGFIHVTDNLTRDYPPATDFDTVPAGLLSILLPSSSENAICWFLREYRQQIDWAGDPADALRCSFARRETLIQGASRPWLACEIDYARKFHHRLSDLLLQHNRTNARLDSEQQIRHAQQDDFFYSAAHDLKEPLRGIRSYAQLVQLEEGGHLSEKNIKRMDTIVQLADHMEELLQSLMTFSYTTQQTVNLAPHALFALVEEVIQIVLQAYPKETIRVDIKADLPEIHCDRAKVQSIYQNLIRNAIKYNDNPVKIIEIGSYRTAELPVFFVRDNGIGILPEYHSTVFQLFHRLHTGQTYGGGSGAGLAIVQKSVEQHGGRIWLESIPDQGTTFFFTLQAEPERQSG